MAACDVLQTKNQQRYQCERLYFASVVYWFSVLTFTLAVLSVSCYAHSFYFCFWGSCLIMSSRKFIHNNLVVIVMLPLIVAIHWGVNRIQYNENCVPEHERKDLPIVMVSAESVIEYLNLTLKLLKYRLQRL